MKLIKNIKGMAMLEVLIAMLIFALALVPLVRLQIMSMDATRAGFYKTETVAAAESMMDYLRTDIGAIFKDKWQHVAVTSGQICSNISSSQEKVACEILNSHDGKFHADGNAVLCILGERPKYSAPTSADASNEENRDQYLISIRAIWYSGKRQDDPKMYNKDLTTKNCGNNYRSEMDSNIVSKENIDSIQIDMAY